MTSKAFDRAMERLQDLVAAYIEESAGADFADQVGIAVERDQDAAMQIIADYETPFLPGNRGFHYTEA